MKVLQVNGLDKSIIHNTDRLTIPDIARKFGTESKDLLSLAIDLSMKMEFYLISESSGSSDRETTVITSIDQNNPILRKCYVYEGFMPKEVCQHILDFMISENMTSNSLFRLISKTKDLPEPQMDILFKTLNRVGVNVHLTSKFNEHTDSK